MENQEMLTEEERVSAIPEIPEIPKKKDPSKSPKKRWTNQEEVMGWVFTGIPILGFLIFGLIPLALSLYISFNHFPGLKLYEQVDEFFPQLSYKITFMGFTNFGMVLSDPAFWKSVLNTLFVVFTTIASLALSIFISMMLYHCKKGKKFFQTAFFIPYVCSLVAITFMWELIFNADHGLLNSVIIAFGGQAKNWITYSPTRFRLVMFVVMLWSGTGFNIILLSAALTNINKSCYEAADIDGAGMLVKFFRITLPAISPTVFYLLVTGIIGALQEFTRFQIMLPGENSSVGGANITVVCYLYQKLTSSSRLPNDIKGIGIATSVGWILALMIGFVTFLNFKISKKWVSYDE